MYNMGIIDVSLFKKIDDIKRFLAENTATATNLIVFAYRDKTDDQWRAIENLTKKDIEKFLENGLNKTLVETAWYLNEAISFFHK